MAETSSLLNCRTGNRTTSSNLVLSALRNQRISVARKCGAFVVERSQARARFRRRSLIDKERAALPPEGPLIACGVTRRARPPGRANLVRGRDRTPHRRSSPQNRQDEARRPSSNRLLGHIAWFHSPISAHEARPPSPHDLLSGVSWLHLGEIPSIHCFRQTAPRSPAPQCLLLRVGCATTLDFGHSATHPENKPAPEYHVWHIRKRAPWHCSAKKGEPKPSPITSPRRIICDSVLESPIKNSLYSSCSNSTTSAVIVVVTLIISPNNKNCVLLTTATFARA